VPPCILRNILENPRLVHAVHAVPGGDRAGPPGVPLLNFQTMVADLTAMPMSNASLLDEGTAAAEAMAMCLSISRGKKTKFLISDLCHPQTIDVCLTRADGLGMQAVVGDFKSFDHSANDVLRVLVQYPATDAAHRLHGLRRGCAQAWGQGGDGH